MVALDATTMLLAVDSDLLPHRNLRARNCTARPPISWPARLHFFLVFVATPIILMRGDTVAIDDARIIARFGVRQDINHLDFELMTIAKVEKVDKLVLSHQANLADGNFIEVERGIV